MHHTLQLAEMDAEMEAAAEQAEKTSSKENNSEKAEDSTQHQQQTEAHTTQNSPLSIPEHRGGSYQQPAAHTAGMPRLVCGNKGSMVAHNTP